MNHAITFYLPWLLSAITITSTVMAGSLHRRSWVLSGLNQILWLIWITNDWQRNKGFLAMNLVLAAVFARNHLMWNCPGYPAWEQKALSRIVHLMESIGAAVTRGEVKAYRDRDGAPR